MTGAVRNLTNRMEETIGERTNLHITYTAMVFSYLFVIRANRLIEKAAAQAADKADAELDPPDGVLDEAQSAFRSIGEPGRSVT